MVAFGGPGRERIQTGRLRRNAENEIMAENSSELMEKLVSLCKRRGFIFPSSEIYGPACLRSSP